jgi:hypothetical protein
MSAKMETFSSEIKADPLLSIHGDRSNQRGLFVYSIGTAILLTDLLLIHFLPSHPAIAYTLVFVSASILYLWIARETITIELPSTAVWLILAGALLARLIFLGTTPIGSDDIYRYMWDGKVQSAGINPYSFSPDSKELSHLHSSTLPALVNHPSYKTLYFPLSEWIFFFCYQISGEHVWAYKLIFLLSEVVLLLALSKLLRELKVPDRFLLLYALCPLTIISFGLDGHLDAVGFPFLILGLLSFVRNKRTLAYVLIGLSISIKPVAVVLLPILFVAEGGWWKRMKTLIIPSTIVFVQFLPFLFSANPFTALTTFAANWTFNGIVFESLYYAIPDNQKVRIVTFLLLCVGLFFLSRKSIAMLDKMYYSLLLLLLFSPVVHPWYVAWLVVFLPIVPRWSGIVYSASVSLTSLTILQFKLKGVWEQSQAILMLEYLPVIAVLFLEFQRMHDKPAAT